MNRPVGVTVLALFNFLCAAFFLMLGMLMALGMGAAGMSKDLAAGAGAMLAGLGVVGAVIFFAVAALYAVMGWGLWTLQNWARIIVLVFAFIGLAFGALGVMGSLLHFEIVTLVLQMVPLAVNALIAWYLMQPHVKQAFGA
jgi:uncharacterized membrane protein (DUF2068 family)